MKRVTTSLFVALGVLVLSQSSFAQNPKRDQYWEMLKVGELKNFENSTRIERIDEYTIRISAKGEKRDENNIKGGDELSCKGNADITPALLEKYGMTAQDFLETSFKTISRRLADIQDTRQEFNFEQTDPLFRQMLEVIKAIDWNKDDDSDRNQLSRSLSDFALLGRYYGKRYGITVIDFLLNIYAKYPGNRRLQMYTPWAMHVMIDAEAAYTSENPTVSERLEMASRLLEYKRTHTEYKYTYELDLNLHAWEFLQNNNPDLLEQFRTLRKERAVDIDN